MDTHIEASSRSSDRAVELPKHVEGSEKALGGERVGALGGGSFTTFWTWRGNGVNPRLSFSHPAINANSRVFVSCSEFNSDARLNRFIGDARMDVHNVAPFNGGFLAWVEVDFNTALNVRFDVLVDP